MKKMAIGLLLLLTGMLGRAQRVFTPQELRTDFTIIRQALEEAHPGLYRFQTKAQADQEFATIEKLLKKGMTEYEFYRLVNPLIAAIGDGHVKFHRAGRPDDLHAFFENGYLPLRLYFKEGNAFVLGSYGGEEKLSPGTRILSINGEDMAHIVARLFRNIYADGTIQSARYAALNSDFASYYGLFTGPSAQFSIAYKEAAGKKGKIVLKAISAKDIQLAAPPEPPYSVSFPTKDVALLRIAVFMENEGMPPFRDFLDSIFRQIREKQIHSLIIDLRNNEGGTDRLGMQLNAFIARAPFRYYDKLTVTGVGPYSFAAYATFPPEMEYLKQFVEKVGDEYHFTYSEGLKMMNPEANAFTGNVYILQNGRSFSVTAEFTAIVKDNRNAVFIGEESGGTMQGNSSGGFAMVTLPNTHLGLDVPLLGYYMHLQNPYAIDKGVPTDHIVIPSVTDILQQRDPVLELALHLAGGK
ncbi:S41 family peptidase [Chitinophaga ginsengisoli]|uniref:Peptidase S41-like protein n=1 Tax=Chitinophaga ginsengisoli TaxID=363837 RepID=A0A2P8GAI3_9BACT|nr:S41 family peptidase [Chitinophaga ginsengisoli]PSL30981.1 peptidase S41-like protein [Chitinophaga ginsengisoli]